jgi:hypothetical protein
VASSAGGDALAPIISRIKLYSQSASPPASESPIYSTLVEDLATQLYRLDPQAIGPPAIKNI